MCRACGQTQIWGEACERQVSPSSCSCVFPPGALQAGVLHSCWVKAERQHRRVTHTLMAFRKLSA